jgi:hypothetical protein
MQYSDTPLALVLLQNAPMVFIKKSAKEKLIPHLQSSQHHSLFQKNPAVNWWQAFSPSKILYRLKLSTEEHTVVSTAAKSKAESVTWRLLEIQQGKSCLHSLLSLWLGQKGAKFGTLVDIRIDLTKNLVILLFEDEYSQYPYVLPIDDISRCVEQAFQTFF